jgi:hypothetical protein
MILKNVKMPGAEVLSAIKTTADSSGKRNDVFSEKYPL